MVTALVGGPPDGETVTFKKGTTVLGAGTSSGGSASFITSTLPVGISAIKAVYDGDLHFLGSTSNTAQQVVKKAATMTSLSSLTQSVHIWAGGDLYRSGHFQARCAAGWRNRHV